MVFAKRERLSEHRRSHDRWEERNGGDRVIERYTLPRMKEVWDEKNKFRKWLEVEILACEAWAKLGVIPEEAVEVIRKKADFSVQKIKEAEQKTRHDVIAFVSTVAESVGEEGKYIHYGLTSSDVVDTALSALMVEAADIIIGDLHELAGVLESQALKYKFTPMIGRTHGVHAEPITLGLKFALWLAETRRNLERMRFARKEIAVGKISGAVGTYAHVDPFIEEYVCHKMGLTPAPISTQILQRDRHAQFLTTLAIIAGCLDKYATEIRALQKTEVREVEEPFRAGQKGSSAMPHKRNPVTCERISGLSRVVRSNSMAALENIPLWHERDISHSSVERIILPDSTILVDYMLQEMTTIIRDLHVYPENMERNLNHTQGLIFSQRVLLALVDRGVSREDAYRIVQSNAMKAWSEGVPFGRLMTQDPEITRYLSEEELEACFDLKAHFKRIQTIYERLNI